VGGRASEIKSPLDPAFGALLPGMNLGRVSGRRAAAESKVKRRLDCDSNNFSRMCRHV